MIGRWVAGTGDHLSLVAPGMLSQVHVSGPKVRGLYPRLASELIGFWEISSSEIIWGQRIWGHLEIFKEETDRLERQNTVA